MATNRGAEHGAAEDGNSIDVTWDADDGTVTKHRLAVLKLCDGAVVVGVNPDGSLFTADFMGTGPRPDEYTWPDGFAVGAEQSTI